MNGYGRQLGEHSGISQTQGIRCLFRCLFRCLAGVTVLPPSILLSSSSVLSRSPTSKEYLHKKAPPNPKSSLFQIKPHIPRRRAPNTRASKTARRTRQLRRFDAPLPAALGDVNCGGGRGVERVEREEGGAGLACWSGVVG